MQVIEKKALTIRQPYAGLIAAGIKRIETRSWRTWYRGELLIHAAQRPCDDAHLKAYAMIWMSDSAVYAEQLTSGGEGYIIATCRLADCVPQEQVQWDRYDQEIERAWGHWQRGHWAWLMEDVKVLATPVRAKGQQSIWTVKPSNVR